LPPSVASRVTLLGLVDEEHKARMLRSVDVYVAPNTGGESFGMILTEAMAAGAPVVASDLEAFRRVLDDAGLMFPVGSAPELARVLGELLDDPARRSAMAARGREVVAPYDWAEVSRRVLEVYHLAIEAAPRLPRQPRPRPRTAAIPTRLRWR
jgi:phosphatidyl-myo-inositol alpha-mannosyltransferase